MALAKHIPDGSASAIGVYDMFMGMFMRMFLIIHFEDTFL